MKKTLSLVAVGVVLGLILISILSDPKPAAPAQPSQAAIDREKLLRNLETAGLITKRTCVNNETQVSLKHWLVLDADGKKNVTLGLAAWCEDQNSGSRMKIVDNMSGRTLAEVFGGRYSVQ